MTGGRFRCQQVPERVSGCRLHRAGEPVSISSRVLPGECQVGRAISEHQGGSQAARGDGALSARILCATGVHAVRPAGGLVVQSHHVGGDAREKIPDIDLKPRLRCRELGRPERSSWTSSWTFHASCRDERRTPRGHDRTGCLLPGRATAAGRRVVAQGRAEPHRGATPATAAGGNGHQPDGSSDGDRSKSQARRLRLRRRSHRQRERECETVDASGFSCGLRNLTRRQFESELQRQHDDHGYRLVLEPRRLERPSVDGFEASVSKPKVGSSDRTMRERPTFRPS